MRESDDGGRGDGAEYRRYRKGGYGGDGRGVPGPSRERETGRDDNLNDRKVGCRNAPKLAITGRRGGWWRKGKTGGRGKQRAAYIPRGPGANFLFWLAFKLNLRGGRS